MADELRAVSLFRKCSMDFSLFGSLIQTDALRTEIPVVGFFLKKKKKKS